MKRAQRGAALLVLVGLIGLLAMATLARALSSPPGAEAALATESALARAREALIAYASWEDNSPGSLPCPDLNNDGVAELSCSEDVGRLPWRTLGLGPLTDGAGECLWYARSPTFSNGIPTSQRDGSAGRPFLNPATPGQITEAGSTGATGALLVAIVIAPGLPLAGQTRGAANGLSGCRTGDIGQFVEDVELGGRLYRHSDGQSAVMLLPGERFNDRVLGISPERHFATVSARVLGQVGVRERDGGTPTEAWWSQNQWCAHLCATGTGGRIALPDGSAVYRALAVLPACAPPCSGS